MNTREAEDDMLARCAAAARAGADAHDQREANVFHVFRVFRVFRVAAMEDNIAMDRDRELLALHRWAERKPITANMTVPDYLLKPIPPKVPEELFDVLKQPAPTAIGEKFDAHEKLLVRCTEEGFWEEYTRTDHGSEITYRNSLGQYRLSVYQKIGLRNPLGYIDQDGKWVRFWSNRFGGTTAILNDSGEWRTNNFRHSQSEHIRHLCSARSHKGEWREEVFTKTYRAIKFKLFDQEEIKFQIAKRGEGWREDSWFLLK